MQENWQDLGAFFVVQLLLGAVNATTLILEGDLMGEAVVWLRVLAAFDTPSAAVASAVVVSRS